MARMSGTLSAKFIPAPQEVVDSRRAQRMTQVDTLPADWKPLVHEYGFCVVDALRNCGVAKPARARHVIETVLNELSPLRGSFSSQGVRGRMVDHLVLVPREPTQAMVEASMATVSNHDVAVTKEEKHRLRLRAALETASGSKRVGKGKTL